MLQPLKWLSLIPSPADTHVEWSNRPVSDSIIKFHLGIWTLTIQTKMVTKVFLGSPEPWNCLCQLFIQLHHILYLWAFFPYGTYSSCNTEAAQHERIYYMQECACIEHTVCNCLERQKGKLQYFAQVKCNSYRDTPHLCQQVS